MAPTIYRELETFRIEMLFDGPLSVEGMLKCTNMKFLLCMLIDPLGFLPRMTGGSASVFRYHIARLSNAGVSGQLGFGSQEHIFYFGERVVLVKIGRLNERNRRSETPEFVYSVMVFRAPCVPELTPFQKSFYSYVVMPDLAKDVHDLDFVSDEQYFSLVDSYVQDCELSVAEVDRLFHLTNLPVFFIVAWFDDFQKKTISILTRPCNK